MTEKQEYVIDASRRRLFDWRELRFYKELFYFFTWRDIKVKYKQTALGFLWAVLQPLIMMIILSVVGKHFNIPSQSLPRHVFIFSGLLMWTIFSSGLTNASNSMITYAPVIKKIYFPRLIIPVSSILGALFDFLMAFILFIPILIYYQQPVSLSAIWYWPLALIVTAIATLGPGTLIAALNVKYRDFRYVIPFLIQILFFLSPVMYPVTHDNPIVQYIIVLSPMYAAIELFRLPLVSESPDMILMSISLGSGLFFLIAGLIYFKLTEDFFADFA